MWEGTDTLYLTRNGIKDRRMGEDEKFRYDRTIPVAADVVVVNGHCPRLTRITLKMSRHLTEFVSHGLSMER